MADVLPSVLQTCKGAAGMQRLAMIRPETHIHLWFNENKNKVHHTTHEKTRMEACTMEIQKILAQSHFLHVSVGFSSTWPAVHPTCCPTTQHSPSKSPLHLSPDRQFSRWKQFPACSSLQLIPKQPCSHFPPVMRPPWSWSTPRMSRQGRCQVIRSGDCYMPST